MSGTQQQRCQPSITGSASVASRSKSVLRTFLSPWTSNVVPVPRAFVIFRRCFPQYADRSCQDVSVVTSEGLENNMRRYKNSLAMHDAFLARCKLLLFHTANPHLRSVSDSLHFAVTTSHILSGVVRAREKTQRGTWFVERCFSDKPKVKGD